MSVDQPVAIALRVAAALDGLGVAYHLGGSLASSIHGEPRATNDIDLVVDLHRDAVAPLADALGGDFAIDRESLRVAVRESGSCNIFYLPTFTKIDLFVMGSGAFDRAEMGRRRRIEVGDAGETLFVKSAEDIVLRKLLWFRMGGGVSERQWRDVVQVLRLNRGLLDESVFSEWVPALGLTEAFAKARAASQDDDAPPGRGG